MNAFALFAVTLTIPDFWTPVIDWVTNLGPMGVLAPYLVSTWTYGLKRARRRLSEQHRDGSTDISRWRNQSSDWDDRLAIVTKFLLTFLMAPAWVPTVPAGKGIWKTMTVGTGLRG